MQFVSDITKAALKALAWSEVDKDGRPYVGWKYKDYKWSEVARADMTAIVEKFVVNNIADIADLDSQIIGYNLVLTANEHGTGFWDRNLGERGDRLTAAAREVGTIYMFTDAEHVEPTGTKTLYLEVESGYLTK